VQTVTVSPKFQVVIRQTVRESLGIRPGQKVQVIQFENRIELVPLKPIRKESWVPQRHGHHPSARDRPAMNVVDFSGWLEYLANESNADFFASAIEKPSES
jgi:AbrB family looped-hinge helix DNA binding protein